MTPFAHANGQPQEASRIAGATPVDLYDRQEAVAAAVEQLAAFFAETLCRA